MNGTHPFGTGPGVDVDIDELRAFASDVRTHVDTAMRPGVTDAARQALAWVPVGARNPSPDLQAVRTALADAHTKARYNTDMLVTNAETLAAKVHAIADGYSGADETSAAASVSVSDLGTISPRPHGRVFE